MWVFSIPHIPRVIPKENALTDAHSTERPAVDVCSLGAPSKPVLLGREFCVLAPHISRFRDLGFVPIGATSTGPISVTSKAAARKGGTLCQPSVKRWEIGGMETSCCRRRDRRCWRKDRACGSKELRTSFPTLTRSASKALRPTGSIDHIPNGDTRTLPLPPNSRTVGPPRGFVPRSSGA